MSADNINTLVEIAIEVLERYAFMLGGPPEKDAAPVTLPDPCWIVTITFRGPRKGGIGLVASPDFARQVAANLYVEAPAGRGDEPAQDAVKELLNIVCGHHLHRVEGDGRMMDFAPPALRVADGETAARCVREKPQAVLAVEGHTLLLFVEP